MLVNSFSVYVPLSHAQNIPSPNYKHISFEAVNNQKIVHEYEIEGIMKEHSFGPPYVVPGSNFVDSKYQKEHLVYETGYKDIYFAVNLSNYSASGVFKKNANNKLEILFYLIGYSTITQDFPQITAPADQKYIEMLSRVSSSDRGVAINNMTPDTLPGKNLPVDKIKVTVSYNQESNGFKSLKPEQLERAKLGLPPENMPCYLFYAPETSIWFNHTPVGKATADKNGYLDFGTIKAHKGWYKAVCQFHIMTPNATESGEQAFFDWDQSWYEAGFYTGVSAWASTVVGTIENVAGTIASWIDKVKSDTSATAWLRDNYWVSYTIHISNLDTSTSIPLKDMTMQNETALNDYLTATGNKKDEDTSCDIGGASINTMFMEAFCGLATTLKGWADAFFLKAVDWLKASLGITENQAVDLGSSTPNTPTGTVKTNIAGKIIFTDANWSKATPLDRKDKIIRVKSTDGVVTQATSIQEMTYVESEKTIRFQFDSYIKPDTNYTIYIADQNGKVLFVSRSFGSSEFGIGKSINFTYQDPPAGITLPAVQSPSASTNE